MLSETTRVRAKGLRNQLGEGPVSKGEITCMSESVIATMFFKTSNMFKYQNDMIGNIYFSSLKPGE